MAPAPVEVRQRLSTTCVHCASELPASAKFCPHCGKAQTAEVSAGRSFAVLRGWAAKAQIALAVGALFGGAGPGAVAQLLGLDPLLGIAGNILSTLPLALAVAVIVAFSPLLRGFGSVIGVAIVLYGSLMLQTFLGGIEDPFRAAGIEIRGGSAAFTDMIVGSLGVYFELYGWPRFILSIMSGGFLGYWVLSQAWWSGGME